MHRADSTRTALIACAVIALLLAVIAAPTPTRAQSGPSGIYTVLYDGGTVEQLVAASDTDVRSVWIALGGSLIGYTPGAPDFVNRSFEQSFAGGVLPAGSIAILVVPLQSPAPPSRISVDECANAVGNGDSIIDGPGGPSGPDHDSVFRSLTVDPSDADTVWLGTERNGFVVSRDGGTTWARHRAQLRHLGDAEDDLYPEIWDIAIAPVRPSLMIAATLDSPGPVAGTAPSTIAGVYRSVDGGVTWRRSNCGLFSSRINSAYIDPRDPDVMLVGIEGGQPSFSSDEPYARGGIYRSEDGGVTWVPVLASGDAGLNGFWHMRASLDGSTIMTFGMNFDDRSTSIGFQRSTDGGTTWEASAPQHRQRMIAEFALSSDGQTIVAHERDSFALLLSQDGGASWTTVGGTNANGPVAISPADASIVIVAGRDAMRRSTNALGTTTQVMTTGAGNDRQIQDIAFAPSDPNVVYMATAGYLVFRSDNAGLTWTRVAALRNGVLGQPSP